MKGKKGGMDCYAKGGKVRNIGGIKAPIEGCNPRIEAMAKGGSSKKMSVDGGMSKMRMDRPGRKASS